MERIIMTQSGGVGAMRTVSYEEAAAQQEKEAPVNEVLSCNLLLKNLIKTNLRLLKINDITAILLF
ncbi:hypothetical protein V1389_14295 [Flavobacterium rakeshii]|uniref:hypothetical protein n=1 Tax=Flavobacterium rakeshii TaxID=1038845 RepID=UPI002E7B3F1E|nr:hypothetical protein [Flavobacterium rakeshii]MEE1899516.1 hypothetical protein [Flavobacterium rakeshii]